jgi:hypothetical protein
MFYLFSDGKNFVRVTKKLKLKSVQDIEKATYWTSLSSAKTWSKYVETNLPQLKLTKAKLTLSI